MTKAVDLSLHGEGTGHLRMRRPVYLDFMPPCNSACPAGENIQSWMAFVQAGNYREAFNVIMDDNPFPAIMGRICVKPCESGCNRNHIDETVNIHAVERFIGDEAIRQAWPVVCNAPDSGKRILVIGAGPSGLSAAYHLRRFGHTVEIMEAGSHAGGLMWSGIPDYRLPRQILQAEIQRILDMGIRIHFDHPVDDLLTEKEQGGFDAVYLALGAQLIHKEDFTSDQSIPVIDAFEFFRRIASGDTAFSGKKAIVYGGGKLALYLSRILLRLNTQAEVLFPGDKRAMPAYDYETDDALAEGVSIQLLKQLHAISDKQVSVQTMRMEGGKATGTGEFNALDADLVIVANRQEVKTDFLQSLDSLVIQPDGSIPVNADRQTAIDWLFAGGDMLPGENRSATIAIGQGKKAARYIDAYLTKQAYKKPDKPPTAGYRKLHMWYKTEAPLAEQSWLAPAVAITSFDEVIAGLNESEAMYEAKRCLSCGNCFECDGCFGACPEDAIIKLGKGNRYKFNYNACTGCAVCYEQCPCHAIEMIPEPLNTSQDANQ